MQLDLNLLTALNALLEEGSVMGAAERLHLSQPAMSRTLGRIREATGDDIFVRTGRTMTPTPYALSIREEVHTLLQQVQAVLAPKRTLDLKMLERAFTLRCNDAVLMAIGPALIETVQSQAPGVKLRLLPESNVDTNELRHGKVDLDIGSAEPPFPEVRFETIIRDRLVVALGADHPCIRGKLTVKRYAEAQHIIVSRRGRLRDPIDDALQARGMQRQIVASAPTSTIALQFVSQSNTVVTVAEHMCQKMIHVLGLRTLPIPLDLPAIPAILAWHQMDNSDPAHTWLRAQIRQLLQAPTHSNRP